MLSGVDGMLGISNPIGKKDRKGAWGDGHLSFELDENKTKGSKFIQCNRMYV